MYCSIAHLYSIISTYNVIPKGVGPGRTLAWPGWKQPDISVKVDTAQLEAGQKMLHGMCITVLPHY